MSTTTHGWEFDPSKMPTIQPGPIKGYQLKPVDPTGYNPEIFKMQAFQQKWPPLKPIPGSIFPDDFKPPVLNFGRVHRMDPKTGKKCAVNMPIPWRRILGPQFFTLISDDGTKITIGADCIKFASPWSKSRYKYIRRMTHIKRTTAGKKPRRRW